MNVAEYVVSKLIEYGVTDTFGVPGGVILRLLYAMDAKKPVLTPHLNYHEQMAGFAACGYSQASGKLGVAYATRGPGITNMITCVAEAYQESLPVLFITAHGERTSGKMRFANNQELNVVQMVSGITKYAVNVDYIEDAIGAIKNACELALSGRKGPVLLDFAANLWNVEIQGDEGEKFKKKENSENAAEVVNYIANRVKKAKRPVILIGDGIRHTVLKRKMLEIANNLGIPILSSRGSQDLVSGSDYYFGYVGSHGTRYSNFILSKADMIITIGNRLAFPINSESFLPIVKRAEIIRIDIDSNEFQRKITENGNFVLDAREILELLYEKQVKSNQFVEWVHLCQQIKENLNEEDLTQPVLKLLECIKSHEFIKIFVSDIGNNEFWLARAFEHVGMVGTILCSKSFGTLGVALGKAIGTYYALREPVCCVIGDQGMQYNLQELNYIRQWKLPILIVLINNEISGMITDHECNIFGQQLVHVNEQSGYLSLDFAKIAESFEIKYAQEYSVKEQELPAIYEIKVDSTISLSPNLPKGRACQDMEPRVDERKYQMINQW